MAQEHADYDDNVSSSSGVSMQQTYEKQEKEERIQFVAEELRKRRAAAAKNKPANTKGFTTAAHEMKRKRNEYPFLVFKDDERHYIPNLELDVSSFIR